MLKVESCELRGRSHKWNPPVVENGQWPGHGKGTMRLKTCSSCGQVAYLQFESSGGRVTDIEALSKKAADAARKPT